MFFICAIMRPIQRVICGISGGVDSAVAAKLLKRKGFQVLGVFMRNWDLANETDVCQGKTDKEDAEWACQKIGIPFLEVDFVRDYWNDVFTQFLCEYENGRTPNPDILCNKYVKFDAFYNHAVENLQADAIATGHYAQSSFGPYLQNYEENEGARLLLARDRLKDQTLFLSQIPQRALRRTMFPLGAYDKSEVKRLAVDAGLGKLANKKESMGICFIGERRFPHFISEYINSKPGRFIDIDSGKVMGVHSGIHCWTIGQRCNIPGQPLPYYVSKRDSVTQHIYVAAGHDHPSLYSQLITTNEMYWIHSAPKDIISKNSMDCKFRFQHRNALTPCTVKILPDGKAFIHLKTPVRAITPGQYAVLYAGNECLGSAAILKSEAIDENAANIL